MKITRKKIRSLILERLSPEVVKANVYEMGLRDDGVDLDTLNSMYGNPAFDAIDKLVDENLGILDDEEGIFYTVGSKGIRKMLNRRGLL
tara:strand:+ start:15 stop:281 length:267 start_codon:yes stop_codon:yes gene_type:complete